MKLFFLPVCLALWGYLQVMNVAHAQPANDSSLIFPADTNGSVNLDVVLQSSYFTSKQVPSWGESCLVVFNFTLDVSGMARIVSAETLNDSIELVPFTDSVVIDSISRILARTPITRLWTRGAIAPVDITKNIILTYLFIILLFQSRIALLQNHIGLLQKYLVLFQRPVISKLSHGTLLNTFPGRWSAACLFAGGLR